MDTRRPIQPDIDAGAPVHDDDDDADRFREAFARWAATVTIVATRDDDGRVHATTVSSFAPISARPPLVVICLGTGAQILPFAPVGGMLGVSLLGEAQGRWASIYTDSFPVASPGWTEDGPPRLPDSVASLACTVEAVHATGGGSRVLVCRVDTVDLGGDDRPLLYWQRGYRKLEHE